MNSEKLKENIRLMEIQLQEMKKSLNSNWHTEKDPLLLHCGFDDGTVLTLQPTDISWSAVKEGKGKLSLSMSISQEEEILSVYLSVEAMKTLKDYLEHKIEYLVKE